MSTRFTRVLFGAVLLAAAVAQAKVVYVVPNGAGAKDGTSWANAYAKVFDAYTNAADGATAEVPGEVRIKKGLYLTKDRVLLQPHVRVYGGFAGGETSADEADPEANWSIISASDYTTNASKYYWVDEKGASQGGIWTYANGVYTYNPIPEGVYWRGSDSGLVPCFVDTKDSDVGCGEDNEFHGLVLTGCSKGGAFQLTAGTASVKIRNCNFLGNTGYQNNSIGTIYTSGRVSLLVEGCRFEGCNTAMNFGSTTADAAITVTSCQFVSCFAKSSTAAGIVFAGESLLQVLDCSFERSWLNSNQPAMDLYLSGRRTVVQDCSFKDSRSFHQEYNGVCILPGAASITVDVERCSFTGIRTSVMGTAYTAGAFMKDPVTSGVEVRVRDSYFANNFLSCKDCSNGYRCYGCIYGMYPNNRHTFVNCTFVDNMIVKTNTASHCGMIASDGKNNYLALVNCVFKDNDCFGVSDGSVTNRIGELNLGTSGSCNSIVNTIMTHSAEDYSSGTAISFAATCIKNRTYTSGLPPLLSCDPMLTAEPETKDGVTAWGLVRGSPCRKGGYPVWEGTDGQFYFRDPTAAAETPWRSLPTRALVSDADAAAVGVSLTEDPLPDAFGENWRNGRVAMGPLNAPVSGLMMLVR